MSRIRIRSLGWAILCMAISTQAFGEDTVQAAWREIRLEFPFVSNSTGYLCHRARHKVEQVLRLAGAHPDTKVRVIGCAFDHPSGYLLFDIETAVPVLAPPKRNSDQIQSEPSRWGADAFPATWRQVNLARELNANLRPSDCELMRILEARVFSQMTVTVEEKPEVCRPDATKTRLRDFVISALVAAPTKS
jgi:hypothetical protein